MSWNGKRVVVIGAARQGLALTRYLVNRGAQVVLTDAQPAEELINAREELAGLSVEWVTGGHPLTLLDGADLVCPSGGVPLTIPMVLEAQKRGIPLSNDSQIFIEAAPCLVVGITGSAGKTTTTTLMGRIANQAAKAGLYRKAFVGGNIGSPLIRQLDQISPEDLVVVELSSFQLEIMRSSPQVAAILNLSPNHLDRHGTMAAYIQAKKNIFSHQTKSNTLVLGIEDTRAWQLAGEAHGEVLAFGRALPDGQSGSLVHEGHIWVRRGAEQQAVIPLDEISLRGDHNLLNVLAACALSLALDLPAQVIRAGIQGFGGVEHRLEFVREINGVQWYNDSKATSPEMAVTAMQAFSERLVVLAGGRDKALPWDEFARQAAKRARAVIAFGEAAGIISAAYPNSTVCQGLEQAVELAVEAAKTGDVVLLAPGGTSFDDYVDYEARGRHFKQLVNDLPVKERD
ncbi:MAG: UDP-N-acetylmuramoyl-L-alanine--D-glutamate ligase [Anaerolineales bacterium]|nr:UDP-N-acetylmuramoyl-L-alanine--D-glutamate ligase [Anaerolineales bacterium]